MTAKLAFQILTMIDAGFNWLASRGLQRDRVQAMLDAAADGDLTTEQVQAELDATQSELDDTAEMIDDLPDDNN